ncbi:MAG: hypothetical protein Q7T82_15810 [Armatimonadota bacterium]|nr:hypothetical protein [Armatimonadota bacterium]
MTHEQIRELVLRWFRERRNAPVGLMLPDGWCGGRPGDCVCELTWIEARPDWLFIELGGYLLLVFQQLRMARSTESELVLEDFKQLVLDARQFGDLTQDIAVYRTGSARFTSEEFNPDWEPMFDEGEPDWFKHWPGRT